MKLRLYVAGNAPNSLRAVANVRAICREHFDPACMLEIVDLFLFPRRALSDQIIVIPTLLRLSPEPAQRVIGNLSDIGQVLAVIGGN